MTGQNLPQQCCFAELTGIPEQYSFARFAAARDPPLLVQLQRFPQGQRRAQQSTLCSHPSPPAANSTLMCCVLLQQVPRAGKLCMPDGTRMPMPDGQVTKRSMHTSASSSTHTSASEPVS